MMFSCVEEIPVDQLEQETFNDTTAGSIPKEPSPAVDNIKPLILSSAPSGTQPETTKSVFIQVGVNELSECRYDLTDKPFLNMIYSLDSNDKINHFKEVMVSNDQSYAFKVRCRDLSSNKNESLAHDIKFYIDKAGATDNTAPVIISLLPSGSLASGTTSKPIVATLSEKGICKYSSEAQSSFEQMSLLETTDGISHSKTITALIPEKNYTYYVLCKDIAGNSSVKKQTSFMVEKEVAVDLNLAAREILRTNCLSCHGGSSGTFADLDVSKDSVLFNLEKKFIVKGEISQSKVYLSLTGSGGVTKMPPSGTLSEKDRFIIRDWIAGMTKDAPVPPPVDNTPPTIVTDTVSEITKTSVKVSWTLNEKASAQVEYGKTLNYGQLSALNNNLLTTHTQVITNLDQDTLYHYRIRSKDSNGNQVVSNDKTFKTLGDINQAPTLMVDKSSATVEAGKQVVFTFQANDPEGKVLDWAFVNKPKFTSFVNNGTSVIITFSPTVSDIGDYNNLKMEVKDVLGLSASVEFDLKVIALEPVANKFAKFKAAIDKSCVSCHGAPNSAFGGLASFYNKTEDYWANSRFISGGDAEKSLVYQRLNRTYTNFVAPGGLAQNMPTGNGNGFNQADADAIKDYINSLSSTTLDCATVSTAPSLTEIRRLNKSEFKNAITDLFGGGTITSLSEIDKLPSDGTYDGFSTVGIRQQTTKTFVNVYQDAVGKIVDSNISKIMSCTGTQTCIENILYPIARRAWSKELLTTDMSQIKAIVNSIIANKDHSFSFTDGINAGMRYILMSPQFIYAVHESAGQENKIDSLNDYELAKKLALFLWKSVPDTNLLDVAKNESLASSAVLTREAKRMFLDSRFSRSRSEFVTEWLRLERLDSASPSASLYGVSSTAFNTLKPLMKKEVHEFVKYISDNKMSLDNLVNGKFTVVDKTLANHYGLAHPGGDFRKVDYPVTSERGGLSTMGGIISMNSNSNRRSIVLSGVWFLNALLCDDPPTPGDDIAAEVAQSLASDAPHRDLAQERAGNPSCAGCHGAIDGAGLPFNTFDSVGRMTNVDEQGRAVDSFGEIYLQKFNNTSEFLEIIKKENKFKMCLTNKMLVYATGETLDMKNEVNDRCKAKKISDTLSGSKDNFEQLVLGVITSENFLKRNVP